MNSFSKKLLDFNRSIFSHQSNNDMNKAAAEINTQFLIVVGEDDRVVTPQPAQEFAALIGATVLVLDEDCGHGDPWCAEDAFATAVSTYINKE